MTEKGPKRSRQKNAASRTCYSPPLFCRAHALVIWIGNSIAKALLYASHQHAHETPYSIFGLEEVVRIEYSVEGACGAQRPWSDTLIISKLT